MAKEKYDLSVDFDKELERELAKLDSAMGKPNSNRKRNKREIVFDSFKDVGKGVVSSYTPNAANIERMVRAAIPTTLTSESYSLLSGASKLKNTISKEFNETRKLGKEAAKAIRSLFPKDSKIGNLIGKVESKLDDGMSDEAQAYRRESELQAGLQAELANNFTKEATLQMLTQNMEEKRHSSVLQVLQAIHDNTTVLKNFSIEISNSYYRKSLELQYKSLFAMKENVAATKALSLQLKEQLENIVKNTAIPDAFKANSKDFLKSSIYTSLANRSKGFLYNNLGGRKLDEMMNKLTKRIEMSFENLKMGISSMIQSTSMLGMITDMGDSLGEMGMSLSKSEMVGGMAGSWLGDAYIRELAEKFARSDKGRKAIFKAKNILADPAFAARQHYDKRIKAGKNNKFLDKLYNKVLKYTAGMAGSGSDYMGKIYKDITDPDAPAMFNNKTQLAIVKIIPDLLSKIYSEIKTTRVGGEPETHEVTFDYNRQKLVSKATFAANVKKDYQRFAESKVKEPMGKLIGGISRYAPLKPEEKSDLANYIIQYMISYNPGASLDALKSDEFLSLLPTKVLRNKVKKGVQKLMDYLSENVYEASIYIFTLNDIRSSIPHIEGRIDAMVGIGEADTMRSLGLLRRNQIENNFYIDRDDAKSYIKGNWGSYKDEWEGVNHLSSGNIPGIKTVKGQLTRLQRKSKVYAGRVHQAGLAGFGVMSNAWSNREEIAGNVSNRIQGMFTTAKSTASDIGKKVRSQYDKTKGVITEYQLREKFKNAPAVIQAKAQGIKVTIDQWAVENGIYDRFNVVKNKAQLEALKARDGIKSGLTTARSTIKSKGGLAQIGQDAKDKFVSGLSKAKGVIKEKIPLSEVEEVYFKSVAKAQGLVTNVQEWFKETGLSEKYEISYDEITSAIKKGKNKAKETMSQASEVAKAKIKALDDAAKYDPIDKIPDDKQRKQVLFGMYLEVKPTLDQDGTITDFGDYCLALGRDPVSGKRSKMAAAKWRILEKGGILNAAHRSMYGRALTSAIRFTRKIDRTLALGITKGTIKGIKGIGKMVSLPFSKAGRSAIGRGLKFGALATADIFTQPVMQIVNAARESYGKDPIFDGGFLGWQAAKSTRKADRKFFTRGKAAISKIGQSLATAGKAVWGFLFKPQKSLADEAAKANLSPDTQIIAAGLDRIANNQLAAQEKDNRAKKKERAGNWLSRIGLFGKKKEKAGGDTKESKGILQWMKEHKTGLTITGGLLMIGGLIKMLNLSFDDVKSIASGIWSGVKAVGSVLGWIWRSVSGIASTIVNLPSNVANTAKKGWNWVKSKLGFGGDESEAGQLPTSDGGNSNIKVSNWNIVPGSGDGKSIKIESQPELKKEGGTLFSGASVYAAGNYLSRFRSLGQVISPMHHIKSALGAAKDAATLKPLRNAFNAADKKLLDAAGLPDPKKSREAFLFKQSEGVINTLIEKLPKPFSWIVEKAKGPFTKIVHGINKVWSAVKSKLKFLWKMATNPKVIKRLVGKKAAEFAARIGAMIAGSTGVGAFITVGFAIYDIFCVLKLVLWDDLTFWQALSNHFLGFDVFDPQVQKELGITDEEIEAQAEVAMNSESGIAELRSEVKKNKDGTYTHTKYYLKMNKTGYGYGANASGLKKAMSSPSRSKLEKEQHARLSKALVEGNLSLSEKNDIIDQIIKGKRISIAGINFSITGKEISPGLINPWGANFSSYGEQMKRRIMLFAWDAFEKTGYPIRINGKRAGLRTMAEQAQLKRELGSQAAAPDPNSPHIKGYGIDLASEDPNVGSDLTKLPGSKELFEHHNLKLPLRYMKTRSGTGADEGWHVEPREARPKLSTFGEQGSLDKNDRDFSFINPFTAGTGTSTITQPEGEVDDLGGVTGDYGSKVGDAINRVNTTSAAKSPLESTNGKKSTTDHFMDGYDPMASGNMSFSSNKGAAMHNKKEPQTPGHDDEAFIDMSITNNYLSEALGVQKLMCEHLAKISEKISNGGIGAGGSAADSKGNPMYGPGMKSAVSLNRNTFNTLASHAV